MGGFVFQREIAWQCIFIGERGWRDYLVWGSIDEVRPQGRGGVKTTALIGR